MEVNSFQGLGPGAGRATPGEKQGSGRHKRVRGILVVRELFSVLTVAIAAQTHACDKTDRRTHAHAHAHTHAQVSQCI